MDDNSSELPVLAGLVVGIAFIVIFALVMANTIHFAFPPAMSLITITRDGEGENYRTVDNEYCGQFSCDFQLFARVVPLPEITIAEKNLQIAFRTGNHLGQRQPDDLNFVIQKLERDNQNSGTYQFINTDLQLKKIGEGRYLINDDWPAGRYILNVIAKWQNNSDNNNSNQDTVPIRYSLHRFNVVVGQVH
jgi:hypothetical protein